MTYKLRQKVAELDSFAVIQHSFSVAVLLYNELVATRPARHFKLDKLAAVHSTTCCEVQVTTNFKFLNRIQKKEELSGVAVIFLRYLRMLFR